MTRRILGSIITLVSILILPYWIYIPVLFLAVILFPFFWEGILLAFLIAILHGDGLGSLSDAVPSFAFYVLILLIILLPIRERLRSYD